MRPTDWRPKSRKGSCDLALEIGRTSSRIRIGIDPPGYCQSDSESLKQQVDGRNDLIPPVVHVENRLPQNLNGDSSHLLGQHQVGSVLDLKNRVQNLDRSRRNVR